jgi:hypothetical protein
VRLELDLALGADKLEVRIMQYILIERLRLAG